MSLCMVTGTVLDPAEQPISGVSLSFNVQNPILETLSLINPKGLQTTSDGSGNWSLAIAQGLTGILSIAVPLDSSGTVSLYKFSLNIPNTSSATFAQVWDDTAGS